MEACIFVEVDTAIKDLEAMKIPVMEELFYNKYVRIVRSIPDERFACIELGHSLLAQEGWGDCFGGGNEIIIRGS